MRSVSVRLVGCLSFFFFFSSRRRHTRCGRDWSSDVCSSDLFPTGAPELNPTEYIWSQLSEYTASTAPRNAAELGQNTRTGIARTRRSQSRLRDRKSVV